MASSIRRGPSSRGCWRRKRRLPSSSRRRAKERPACFLITIAAEWRRWPPGRTSARLTGPGWRADARRDAVQEGAEILPPTRGTWPAHRNRTRTRRCAVKEQGFRREALSAKPPLIDVVAPDIDICCVSSTAYVTRSMARGDSTRKTERIHVEMSWAEGIERAWRTQIASCFSPGHAGSDNELWNPGHSAASRAGSAAPAFFASRCCQ